VAKKKAPDFTLIKTAYLKGGRDNSIAKLASRFGISADALAKRASREKWKDQRQETVREVSRKLPGKIADIIVNEAAEWTRESLRMATVARKLIADKLGASQAIVGFGPEGPSSIEVAFLNAPRDVKDWINALAAADKMGRLALGLKDGGAVPATENPLTALVQAIDRSKKRAVDECSSGPTSPPSN
jgi:hypothetical protein